jgi:peptide/nickel transport system substrate-binding protein
MLKHSRRFLIFSVFLAVLLALFAGSSVGAQEEKVLVIGSAESVDSLDPGRGFSFTPLIVHRAIYDTLVTWPPDSVASIEPQLAESWEVSEDGMTYTFKLREG